ncbi:low specificity L-threonine aldolase [Rhodobacterales bacterium HKCCE3408]|nr:low specificity L-threonine aldolase [Rhodobacterales bacterium HKCCE3408]
MNFASDNAGPAAPRIMDAMMEANADHQMPYGNDPFTARAVDLVREVLEAPEATVHLVATGTAANALALSTLVRPWDAIFCHHDAHVEVDECGAVELFAGGAKLRRVPGADAKMTPDALAEALAEIGPRDVHSVQPGALTLTQLTERGTAYTPDEIGALVEVARSRGMKVHMDGARFANAVAAAGISPAEMTWKTGIDALSFGGTKNGCLGVEAVVLFRPDLDWETSLRRKRTGHLWSKGKYLGAQMQAYLEDGLWLDLAGRANAAMTRLMAGLGDVPGARAVSPPAGNLVYLELPRAAHARAVAAGVKYYLYAGETPLEGPPDEPVRCRIVCDWSKGKDDVDALLTLWRG